MYVGPAKTFELLPENFARLLFSTLEKNTRVFLTHEMLALFLSEHLFIRNSVKCSTFFVTTAEIKNCS